MKNLSSQELAVNLEVPVDTLERWIRQGRIPVIRTGHMCSFSEDSLSRWAKQHRLAFGMKKGVVSDCCSRDEGHPGSVLERGAVLHLTEVENAEEILRKMVAAVPGLPSELAPILMARLLERERLGSTGIGRGLAIPHPRTPLASFPDKNCIVAAFTDKAVPYNAIDRKPVFAFFLLLAPDVREHLTLLSRLSGFFRDEDFYRLLMERPEKARLVEALSCREDQPIAPGAGK